MEKTGDYNRDMSAGMKGGGLENLPLPPGFMKQISKLRWRKYIKYSIVF
jgi:hypothetical protein